MSEESEDYKWIQSRYEACVNGEISEEEYMQDLEEYKRRLGADEQSVSEGQNVSSPNPSKVRSTSIAGLRNKLLEELRKD